MTDDATLIVDPERPALSNISFHAPPGKLTCVVGPVGCGKSALLHAILGELNIHSGTATVPSDIAYTSQTPWLLTTTLRSNILFGRELDQKRYDATLAACALGKDLAILPNGDLTEIGEKGINLSGGQKQRVSLARALYSNAPCYLMDEPLSAVDMHVAAWLFDNCINGMMATHTRILVTHQIQFLSRADFVVVMHEGQITHSGSYTELVNQGVDFESIITKKTIDETKHEKGAQQGATDKIESQGEIDEIETENQTTEKPGIIEEEERQIGKVKWDIYKQYFEATGQFWLPIVHTVIVLPVTILVYVLAQTVSLISSYWLTFWAGDTLHVSVNVYFSVFVAILLSFGLLTRLGLECILKVTYKAASSLHNRMLDVVLAAKPSFFDMTPTGRVLNRFSKDQNTLDQMLMIVLHEILECFMMAFCSIGIVCIVTPIMIPAVFLLGILFYFIQHYYRCTIRELKRLNSISFSGVSTEYRIASESMNGLSVIRAFKVQQTFAAVFNSKVNANSQFFFNEFCVNRWLDTQLEWIAVIVVFLSSAAGIYLMDSLGPGLVALVITSSLNTCESLTWGVRQFSQLEVQMSSVERILHYCTAVPQEPTSSLPPPSASWPEHGTIEVKDLVVKYRDDLDPVLRGVTFSIKAGEKIGVVGRTGAGKSTLTNAIFRMVDATSGSICIDGVSIYDVGLDVLRSRLSIIPQDPTLFSGSIRMNLDPFGKHADEELWSVLDQVHLKKHVSQLSEQLGFCFKDNGEGFSVGQRQLLCIGRAMLRNAKILVMDEATASLDFNTDVLIKKTVRDCFADKTTITIAHRLDTIMDSDRVMVYEQGQLVEFDKPSTLLSIPSSKFALLVAAAQKSFKQASSQ